MTYICYVIKEGDLSYMYFCCAYLFCQILDIVNFPMSWGFLVNWIPICTFTILSVMEITIGCFKVLISGDFILFCQWWRYWVIDQSLSSINKNIRKICMHTYAGNLVLVSNYMLHDVFQDELHEKLMD